ncbi:hypothetical protein LOK49_LG15G01271 [Camellia lanceoleosa]|uniref:Uncharacterized protein n=1 Tax=Camellia lanceoleosa TaxID=1840588 RepID=A0ACC0F166_9ERIC|nr:hypothetical protein LOK49_LG15G01271 [Camellia lanceoleosa]
MAEEEVEKSKAQEKVWNSASYTPSPTISFRASGEKTRFPTRSSRFRVPTRSELSSPVKFLKRLGDKVVAAMNFVSRRQRQRRRRSPSNVSSSSGRSNPSIAPLDSHHRAEAISDCIEFINSSSSLQRSNSVPTNPV